MSDDARPDVPGVLATLTTWADGLAANQVDGSIHEQTVRVFARYEHVLRDAIRALTWQQSEIEQGDAVTFTDSRLPRLSRRGIRDFREHGGDPLYGVARQVCHDAGIDWTDPRTGEVHPAPRPVLTPADLAELDRLVDDFTRDWSAADRISDEIVAAVNRELASYRGTAEHPLQILAGQLLALLALSRTMPDERPASLERLLDAAQTVLNELRRLR